MRYRVKGCFYFGWQHNRSPHRGSYKLLSEPAHINGVRGGIRMRMEVVESMRAES
jgi:hypothetical protein